jgi:chemotaxis protein histidine kinase CheA
MSAKMQLSFKEYFIYEFLDRALQKVNEINDIQVQKNLTDFVASIKTSGNFFEGIETLAQYPGTSDLSIFFADILENLSIYNPDEVHQKLDELSTDLVEMFNLLKNDEVWIESLAKFKAEVGGVYAYVPETTSEKLSFLEFCEFWLKNRFNELFDSIVKEEHKKDIGKQIFQILITRNSVKDLLQILDNATLNSILEQFEAILDFRKNKIDEHFLGNFYQMVDGFYDDLIQLIEEKPDVIETFLSQLSEKQLVEFEEKARSLEEKVYKTRRPVPGKETQLEGVLSEYLTKEFHETLNDLEDIITELSQSETEQLWDELGDNAGYLIEMGSIHSVPFLERFGQSLKEIKDELQKINIGMSADLKERFFTFFHMLKDHAADLSSVKEEELIELIENHFNQIRNLITELAIARNIEEDRYNILEHNAKVVTAFEITHQYYWELISKEYAKWLSHKNRDKEAQNLSSWLQHLYFWYEILGFDHVLKAIQYLNQIFLTLQYGEVSTALDAYIQEFLMTMPSNPKNLMKEKIDSFLEKIQSEGIKLEEYKVDFTGARGQVFKLLTGMLSKEFLSFQDAAYMLDRIENYIDRFQLMNEKELLNLLSRFKKIVEENYEIWKEEDFNSRINKSLAEFVEKITTREFVAANKELDLLNDMILSYKFEKDMRQTSPTITLVEDEKFAEDEIEQEADDELKEIFQAEVPEEVEEIPVKEEDISEEDLHQLFIKEGEKYVSGIRSGIQVLRENAADSEGLELIHKNAHALKGSSKMMGYDRIGEVCEKIEHVFEKLIELKKPADSALLDDLESLCEYLFKDSLEDMDLKTIFAKWEAMVSMVSDQEQVKETEEYVVLSEQDQELLQIFEEEAGDVIKQLKGIAKYLKEFKMESKIKSELEQALHKIDSAAKMLGFEEIAIVVDKIQTVLDSKELDNEREVKRFSQILANSTSVIDHLSRDKRIEKTIYDQTLSSLDNFLAGTMEEPVPEEQTTVELKKKITEKIEESSEYVEKFEKTVPTEPEKVSPEIRDDVIQLFVNEVNSTMDQLREALVELEIYPDDHDKIYHLFRLMHTLKGAASMVNMEKLQQLAHKFEDVLELYYQHQKPLPIVMINLLQKGLAEIEFMMKNIVSIQEDKGTAQLPVILSNLDNLKQNFGKSKGEKPDKKAIDKSSEELKESLKDQEIVKIPIAKLDDLLNNSVELVVTNNELVGFINKLTNEVKRLENERKELTELKSLSRDIFQHYIEIYELAKKLSPKKDHPLEQSELIRPSLETLMNKLENLYMEIKTLESGIKNTLKDFELNFEKTNKISNRLYDYILQVRMVPISLLFDLFPRAVEEISKKYNKKVQLKIEGGETELDRSMVEHLFEPLLHIIRNAIDHGIETVDEREALGKSENGTIYLSAKQEKDHVVITIADDGRGIDFDKIRKKAIEKGLVSEEISRELDENELVRFLFQPGFSTSDKISEMSGRGIGLDVVERQIRRLKGELQVETEKGKGTTFIMKFPITLSVSQCILIKIEDNSFGIPIYNVEKTFEIKGKDIDQEKNHYIYEEGSRKYELIYLNELMNLGMLDLDDENKLNKTYSVIILRSRVNYIGLLVDKIDKRAELIVKPLGQHLQNFPYISGGAILPDASIALILDVDEMIEKFVMDHTKEHSSKIQKNSVVFLKRITKKTKIYYEKRPTILLIDDSESVREYMKKLFASIGFDIMDFGNVNDAKEYLKKSRPHLIIVDLELPEISGYEFILSLGKDENLKDIPFMFFTGKKVEMIENLAKDLNALGYILKPFDEKELQKKFSKLFVPIET